MHNIAWSQLLKHPILSAWGGNATHRPIRLPEIKENGAVCIFGVFLLSGTLKMGINPEKTVCFQLSTGNSSAQTILSLIPSNFHHGLSTCLEHIPPHTTFVHLNFGCMRRSVRGLETQLEWQKFWQSGAQPRLSWLILRCPHPTYGVTRGTQHFTTRDPAPLLSHSTIPLKKSIPL